MFRPSGTPQYNAKYPKIPLKLNEFESVIYNHVYRVRQFQCISRNLENEEDLYQNFKSLFIRRHLGSL